MGRVMLSATWFCPQKEDGNLRPGLDGSDAGALVRLAQGTTPVVVLYGADPHPEGKGFSRTSRTSGANATMAPLS